MRNALYITLVLLFVSPPVMAENLRVITRENAVRQDCRFYSPVKMKVRLNDELDLRSAEGDWYRVGIKGAVGCIHKSAVSRNAVAVSKIRGSDEKRPTSEEVSLAGKGFNPRVEEQFKSGHPELRFGPVDEVERFEVSDDAVFRFMKEGGLLLP